MNGVAWLAIGGAVLLSRGVRAGGTGADSPDLWIGGALVMYTPAVRRMADAIAYAEGFYTAGNPIPKRNHNPGDLKASSVRSVGADAQGHLIFESDADGWDALHRQLQLIVDGRSRVYSLDMTIADMGARYAEGAGNWVSNVCRRLNVPLTTRLREVLL